MHQTFRRTAYLPWHVPLPKTEADHLMKQNLMNFEHCLEHGFIEERYEFRDGMDIPTHTGPHHPVMIDKIDVESFTYDDGPWQAHVIKMVVEFTPHCGGAI